MSTSKPALSDEWRIRPSQNKPIDLANAIRSIQKVIAAVDDRECSVSFARQNQSSFKGSALQIRIDPRFALTSTPISGTDFDVLAGLGVHEGLHSHCQSDKVKNTGSTIYEGVATVAEEIYVDNFAKRNFPILGKYVHLARQAYKVEPNQINWDDIFVTWTAIAVFGLMPEGPWLTDIKKVAQLQLLMETSTILMAKNIEPRQRQKLYEETAERLEKMMEREKVEDQLRQNKEKEPELELDAPHGMTTQKANKEEDEPEDEEEEEDGEADNPSESNQEVPPNTETGEEKSGSGAEEGDDEESETDTSLQPSDEGEGDDGENGPDVGPDSASFDSDGDTDEEDEDGDNDKPQFVDITQLLHPATIELSPELESQVGEVLELGIVDMSQEVADGFNVSGSTAIVWTKSKEAIDTSFNEQLARQLGWVKDYKNTKGKQKYRNEPRGKLDGRRLYRAPIDGRIFKKTVIRPQQELDLVLLLDASGSMMGNQDIYEDAKALYRALPEATVLSYEDGNQVNIVEHTADRAFRKVQIGGGTPTSLALAATSLKYPRSLIIHFTDGGCNQTELAEIMPQIHDKFPLLKMVHIQLASGMGRGAFGGEIPEQEGWSRTIVMDSIHDFPNRLKDILKEW